MRTAVMLFLAALLGASGARAASLYDDLGGRPGVARIVQGLTELYKTDARIKDDFDNINSDWLAERLEAFLCRVADGPCVYQGRDMAAAHKGLHLTTAKFNAVAEDLEIAMDQAGVPYATQTRLMARLAPMQRAIVTR